MARKPVPAGTAKPTSAAHIVSLVRKSVPPMHRAGIPFVVGPLAVAALGRRNRWVRTAGLGAAGACAAFFRNPSRVPPNLPGVVVAPADGEVALVDTATPPPELALGTEPLPRVSIFLSVLDVHVQRSPVAGTVAEVVHRDGQFLSADLADASEVNERTSMRIHTADGQDVGVVQIAGLIARRIVCDARVGDAITLGDTYGLIRFGSRVDTYLPAGSEILVLPGQRSVGAETVLARLP
ncbi:phosphatidylserine decarboxylase [Rhodococcus rhodnii]|uniref:Phosphatidylserine decarboxylase proenzyme n=2 Tax=Rhodococcus rhodnii TaxID=38312 RepID=R7WRK1_9NOCA|nr:phosphatidylserine decarboxylase [Rhodococcus rhodnii]EOM77957.1 phosphatidylserine decarboxylase [Rhodococcus rhodnii LMG 5362]TXG92033.1 phosphatidylserine decarboxylase [Rhodococcus rhodnii]